MEEIMIACHHILTLREYKISIEALKEILIRIEVNLTGMIIITQKIKLNNHSKGQIMPTMISTVTTKEGMNMMKNIQEKILRTVQNQITDRIHSITEVKTG